MTDMFASGGWKCLRILVNWRWRCTSCWRLHARASGAGATTQSQHRWRCLHSDGHDTCPRGQSVTHLINYYSISLMLIKYSSCCLLSISKSACKPFAICSLFAFSWTFMFFHSLLVLVFLAIQSHFTAKLQLIRCLKVVRLDILQGWQRKLDPDLNIMDTLHTLLFRSDWATSLSYTIDGLMGPWTILLQNSPCYVWKFNWTLPMRYVPRDTDVSADIFRLLLGQSQEELNLG